MNQTTITGQKRGGAGCETVVVLVSCAARKAAGALPAKDLYISDLFQKSRAYAEKTGEEWFILSALYGLVEPETVIEAYDRTLNQMRRPEREAWATRVAGQITDLVPKQSRLVFLAGENYRRELVCLLDKHYQIEIPMHGLRVGEQLKFLKEAIS
jgi:cytoplasmic iron level regulating protein YaaA (DUF328/UPF0246 family)